MTAPSALIPAIVPVEAIRSNLTSFPNELELQLDASDCWSGIAALAAIFQQAGTPLRRLRCGSAGQVSCAVEDGGADPGLLAGLLAARSGLVLTGWTTVILSAPRAAGQTISSVAA
jgi:hypothetical protein